MPWPKGVSKPKPPNSGRKKGQPNKVTKLLKEQILEALDLSGGTQWLVKLASEEPTAFAGLLGKVLPTQITGSDGGPVVIKWKDS